MGCHLSSSSPVYAYNNNNDNNDNNNNHNDNNNNNDNDHNIYTISSPKNKKGDVKSSLESFWFDGYTHNALCTPAAISIVKESWNNILAGDSDYLRVGKLADKHFSPVTAFYTIFYEYLCKNYPSVQKKYFSEGGIQKQAKSLFAMISIGLNLVGKSSEFLKKIARSHGNKGISAHHYKPICDTLFYTLQVTLGTHYTKEVEESWKLMYSHILNIMIPESIQETQIQDHNEIEAYEKERLMVEEEKLQIKTQINAALLESNTT